MKTKLTTRKTFLAKVFTILMLPFCCLMITLFIQSCRKESPSNEMLLQKEALKKFETSTAPYKKKLQDFYQQKNLARAFANPKVRKQLFQVAPETPPPGDDPYGQGNPYPINTPPVPDFDDITPDDGLTEIVTEVEAKAYLDPMIASSIEFLHSYDVTDADIIDSFGSLTDSRIPTAAQEAYIAAKLGAEHNEAIGNAGVALNGISSMFINTAYAKIDASEFGGCVMEAAGFTVLTDIKAMLESSAAISWTALKATVRTTFKKAATRLLGPVGAIIFMGEMTWCLYQANKD